MAAGSLEKIAAGGMQVEVGVEALDRVDLLEPALGPSAIATATARFSAMTGEGSTRSSQS